MWPRVDGMRAMELGTPDAMRVRLNGLVLSGKKTATTGLLTDYAEETEGLEYPGERMALVDTEGKAVATLEITRVEVTSFADVTWEHVAAEGEGHASVADWRAGHARFWSRMGTPVADDTPVVCVGFRLVEGA